MNKENDELLVVYKKNSLMSYFVSKMLEQRTMVKGVVNREIILDVIGDYNVIYSDVTDVEEIINQLKDECMGGLSHTLDTKTLDTMTDYPMNSLSVGEV